MKFGRPTHLYSILIAPLTLFILTCVIMHIGGGGFTFADVASLSVLARMTLVPWLPAPRRIPGKNTARQEDADDVLQTPIGAAILGMSVWGVANVIGNYLLTS